MSQATPVGLSLQQNPGDAPVGPNRDMVRMTLLSADPKRIKFQQRWYIIEPGKEALVPWGLMVCIAGNPYATDANGRKDRTEELRRIRNLWGIYHDHNAWENRPVIQFKDLDDNLLPTPLWDPDESIASVSQAVGTTADNQFLMTQLEKLTAQMAVLQEQLAQRDEPEAPAAPPPIPTYANSNANVSVSGPADSPVQMTPMSTNTNRAAATVPEDESGSEPAPESAVTEDTGRPKVRVR